MSTFHVHTLPDTGIFQVLVFTHSCMVTSILYTPTCMHTLAVSQHTPVLEICFHEQVWKSLSVFSGSTTCMDLIFLEILQETKASKIVINVDMMVFAF